MTDYAEIIKSSVPMRDAVERYTGQRVVLNRICCPIHHGKDRNMRIYSRSYYCWVCHASGDVIQFVMGVMGLSFKDAMARLNDDFNLDLPIAGRSGISQTCLSDLNRINRAIAQRRLQEQFEQIDSEIHGLELANLSGLLNTVEIIINNCAPRSPDDRWREDWCEALKLRTELRDELV